MKILIIMGRYLPGYRDGGPVRTIKNLVDNLGTEYEFYIVCADRDHGDEVPYPDIKVNDWNQIGNASVYYVRDALFQIDCLRELCKGKDVIYVCGCFNEYARMMLHLKKQKEIDGKLVIASMGLFSKGAFHIKYMKKKMYIELLKMKGMFRNVIWSATDANEVNDIKTIIGKKSRCYIAQDLPRYVENTIKVRKKDSGSLKVVFLSRISKKKNLLYAIQVLAKVSGEVIFDIYGNEEDEAYWMECQQALKKLPENIQWNYCGELQSEEVVNTLRNYHIMLFPTLGENYGHVIHEALSAGCNVLISDQTKWNDLEEKKIGYSIPLNKFDEFVLRIQEYIGLNQEQMDERNKAAVEYAISTSDISKLKAGYEEIFNDET